MEVEHAAEEEEEPEPSYVPVHPTPGIDVLDISDDEFFEELVRTCRLSRAWRRRWESVPGLDIQFDDPWSAAAPDARALWRCSAPVGGFTALVRMGHFHRAARWLLALARKRVQKLVLRFDYPDSAPVVGPALFSCAALTDLELYGYCHLPRAPPGFQGFPNLVTLVLDNLLLRLPGAAAQLQRLISSAPGLRELSLHNLKAGRARAGLEICAIRAPSLRILRLFISIFLDNGCRLAEDLQLLEVASISIDALLGTPAFVDTFPQISNVNTLFFYTDSKQIKENPLEGISWKFQNLRAAHLTANFGKLPSIRSIFSLLRFGPHVEELHIQAENRSYLFKNLDPAALDDAVRADTIDQDILDAEISDDLFANLKHISLYGMGSLPNDMWFMKSLLSKTGLLESFVVTFNYGEETEFYVEACEELEACEKASPQAQLELRPRKFPA
ncbi:uncharacterized protein LOC119292437 [Triticum dicoccoides]|uniref:uncharacterized protein LOC119292437 n=1 Tax=Triticum dicoccoides TaxID=85692 RepID=UPI0018903FEC|nr:uncharacterized protein LOC119292437 [Triticum dicoccoides]